MQELAYKIAKVLSKTGVFLVSILAFLGVLIIAVTQLQTFRAWAVERGLASVNDLLLGELDVADIDGDLVTGISIKGVELKAGGTTFARVPRISVNYELVPILESRKVRASIIVHRPEILLQRGGDGLWNFSKIAPPSTDTTDLPREPLDWIFDVRSLEIRDGELVLQDLMQPEANLLNTTVSRLNLEAGTYFSESRQAIDIRHLSFLENQSNIRLIELAGDISIDSESGLHLRGLQIETEGSYLELDLTAATPGLLDSTFGSSLLDSQFNLQLTGDRVSTEELQRLIPALQFLGGTYGLEISANGRVDAINVEKLSLQASGTSIDGSARLSEITDPKNFEINAELRESTIRYQDLPLHLPGIDLSSIEYLRNVEIKKLRYAGRPSDATATFEIATSVGEVKGGGTVRYGDGRNTWRGDVYAANVDLTSITRKAGQVDGVVNGRFLVEGNGFDPDDMEVRARARLGSSQVMGRGIDRAWIEAGYGDGGMIIVDTALVALRTDGGPPLSESVDLERLEETLLVLRDGAWQSTFMDRFSPSAADIAAVNGRPSVRLAGWFDTRDPALPKYRGVIETDRLDLSAITLDPGHSTRLGLTMNVEGEGLDVDRLQAFVQLDAYDIQLPNGEEILPFQIDSLLLQTNGDQRRLLLASDVADAEIVGRWRFETLFPTLAEGVGKLVDYVARKTSYESDEFAFLIDDEPSIIEPIVATYRFEPKDLSVIEAFMPGTEIELDADLTGTVSGTTTFLGLTVRGDVRKFLFRQGESTYNIRDVEIDADIRNISSGAMDDLLEAEISVRSDSVYQLSGTRISAPNLDMTFRDGALSLQGAASINDEYSFEIDGGIDVVREIGYRLRLDSLTFGLSNGQQWHNQGPIAILTAEDGATVESFGLRRAGAETIRLTGRYAEYERFEDVLLNVSSVPFSELKPFLHDASTLEMLESLGGRLDSLQVGLQGTLENPELEITGLVQNLSYTNVSIGSLQVDASYRNRNLTGSLQIAGSARLKQDSIPLLAEIEIRKLPIDLAFASREERLVNGELLDIVGTTNDLPLAIIGPFVPGILIQKGTTNLEFSVGGRLPDVDYRGVGKLSAGQIVVESTNVTYLVDARFELQEERLELQGVSLRNLPSDLLGGKATAFGNITFDGFSPDAFNIGIKTNGLLVLNEGTQAVNDQYYGDLVIATPAGRNLTFGGTYRYPRLYGDVIILESDLKYPYRERVGELQNRVEFVEYEEWVSRADQKDGPRLPSLTQEERDSLGILDLDSAIVERNNRQREEDSAEEITSEFMDRLRVDLNIRVPKGVKLTIEIGLLQQLELLIDDGGTGRPLDFSMLGDDMNLTGEVRLLQGSKFLFLRSFDATGSIIFDENILNPAFAIDGVYKGRRFLNGESQSFRVGMKLGGNLDRPAISFTYAIEGVESNDDPAQKQADAILLLLVGRRQSELFSQATSEGDIAADAFLSGADALGTNVLGAALSGVFKDIGGLQAVEFDGNIDDPGGTTFRFVYAIGDVLLRYEGRITQFSDGTVTVELPLELLLRISEFKNLSLQLQRDVLDEFGSSLGSDAAATNTENVFRVRLSLRTTF